MIYHYGNVKVEETDSNMISPEKGTVVFEVQPADATSFAVTIERRGEEFINTAKTLLSQKVEDPEDFDEFLRVKAETILKKKYG
ncbi:hypothetical protein [Alkalicoccus daliensis]|uniref:Uncharacterized protein n=1 Tax=Alkalicoccus daliensis TaxID=745820 RepID=A0A1H0GU89_9BACI|nr:hypothetical protein [Alkalicoccus daliensis]SDO10473.1 hypothetical protein SAMN04488053_10736 [Alkalicoccus daliensis]